MITRALADFAVAAQGSPDALRVMRLSVADWAACAIAGRDEPVARIVRGMILAEAGRGDCSLLGGGRAPMRGAAMVNGTISHALDYDDTHFAHIGHPSVAVVPAALAVAQARHPGLPALIEAALIGAEISVRVGLWLGRGHYQIGFHQTATAGAFGATAAAGRLLGLDGGQMAHAFGLCATRASGLKSQFGTMGKPWNAGIAASNGVECALLAAAGMLSRPDGIEAAQGFGATHAGAAEPALDGLGSAWRMLDVSHKFHACCHGLHAMLEALAGRGNAMPDGGAGTEGPLDAVLIETNPRWLTVCNIAEPTTGLEAKFSYRLTAAMALAGRSTAALDSYSDAATRDPVLVALRDKVTVVAAADIAETAARVTVQRGGQRQVLRHDLLGPMAIGDRADRLRAKARALLGERAAPLWQALAADDLDRLAAMLEA